MLSSIVLGLAVAASMERGADDAAARSSGVAVAREQAQPTGPRTSRKKDESSRRDLSYRYGAFEVKLGALLQEDAHRSDPASTSLSAYELRRNRVSASGSVFKHVEFDVEREITTRPVELGKQPKSPWKDAFVNVTYLKNAQVQGGRFKIPFGLDELTGSSRQQFVYRSAGATALSPARDAGTMVHGRFFRHRLNYWGGLFAHDGDHSRSTHIAGADQTVAGRLTSRVLGAAGTAGLEIGTAATLSAVSDASFEPNGLRGRTVVTGDTFFPAVYVKGRRRRWEGDVDWRRGPIAARAEFIWASDDRLRQGIGDQDLPDVRARSWFVSSGWSLPRFGPRGGTLELVGRIERLWFDSSDDASDDMPLRGPRATRILPNGDRAVTVGANWTVNRWFRVQVNAVRERVEDSERGPVKSGAPFWSQVARLQFKL